MSDKHEWACLGECQDDSYGRRVLMAVWAALRCRRVVQVRTDKDGVLGYYAHVPLPRAVLNVGIGTAAHPQPGVSTEAPRRAKEKP